MQQSGKRIVVIPVEVVLRRSCNYGHKIPVAMQSLRPVLPYPRSRQNADDWHYRQPITRNGRRSPCGGEEVERYSKQQV
jgi:hypothetical protein